LGDEELESGEVSPDYFEEGEVEGRDAWLLDGLNEIAFFEEEALVLLSSEFLLWVSPWRPEVLYVLLFIVGIFSTELRRNITLSWFYHYFIVINKRLH